MHLCRFIRLHYTPPLPTDESAEEEADMAKMMFMIVKRQWRHHQPGLTRLFAVCGHKENYLKDQVRYNNDDDDNNEIKSKITTIAITISTA